MLDDLDRELESRRAHFVRYADDANIYVKSFRAGKRVYESVVKFVEGRLKLKVNSAKSAVDRPSKRKFLGFSFTTHTTKKPARIRLAPKTLQRFRKKIRVLTKRSQGISLEERLRRLNEYVRGWFGYFKLAETPSILKIQDEWIRHRLRACLLKQWKLPRTRKKKLISLGVPEKFAAMISGSSKSIWKLSRTIPVQQALGFAFWHSHKLFSLTENYRKSCQSL
jgi:RNA-directed DNA polymerase